MAITISIPSKSAGGSLNRTTLQFTPDGANATAIRVTLNWPSFGFTLSASDGSFPAGAYAFTGKLTGCPAGAIACGTVTWPSLAGTDPTDWEATGGPEDEDDEVEDTEEPAAETE